MKTGKTEEISSPQNPRIKTLVKLRDRKTRELAGALLIEGGREILRALTSGVHVDECYFCPDELSATGREILAKVSGAELFQVSKTAFAKAAMREGSDGIIVVARRMTKALAELPTKKNPLFIAVEGVEKPGNLGAILRTADAIGIDGVVVLDDRCDIYSPNVIRASIGAVFHVPVFGATVEEFSRFCRDRSLRVYGAALADRALNYVDADFSGGSVILCGNEAQGLSEFWMRESFALIKIPMNGIGDSLNVSVAAAVIAFEAARQRGS
jgi:TrmH family RNA methyltransferase